MNFKELLQDLHFRLSNSSSAPVIEPQSSHLQYEKKYHQEFEDRFKMTEKWVAQVCLRNRRRSISSSSYFRVESVCDRLKKSFLKPVKVTQSDLEDLRIKMSQLKIEESNFNCLSTASCKISDISVERDINIDVNNAIKRNQETRRFRSRTVPLLYCITNAGNNLDHFNLRQKENEEKEGTFALNCLPSVRSASVKKDILLDENRNQIEQEPSASECDTQEISYSSKDKTAVQSLQGESIIPCSNDLKMVGKISKAIQPNRIIGSYENEFDYLKTQFDLLKVDFLLPLKEGIADYKKQLRNGIIPKEVKNLKLYHNVLIKEPCFKQNQLGISVDMGSELTEKIGDKDFMNGSLVLLTPNNFKDVFVGIVLSQNFVQPMHQKSKSYFDKSTRRKSNILMIQLSEASHFDPNFKCRRVLLAESKAFFQPYYYVMKIFQEMDDSDLPLKEYLVRSQSKESMESPSYLHSTIEYTLGEHVQVTVLNEATWPRAEALEVNDSQLVALKRALSEKLVLIQGPPGTGKTYLGCKVAKALLQNKHVWNSGGNQPILLMCQTNHALDQFMELLVPLSKKLIRVGSQSKSNILAPFNIRKWMKRSRKCFSKQSDLENFKVKLAKLSHSIQVCYIELTRLTSHGVLDLETLVNMEVISLRHSMCFSNPENFLIWLEEARDYQVVGELHEECMSCNGDTHTLLKCYQYKNYKACCNVKKDPWNPHVEPQEGTEQFSEHKFGTLENLSIKYIITIQDLELALRKWQAANAEKPADEQAMQKNAEREMENRFKFFKSSVLGRNENGVEPMHFECLWNVAPHFRWTLYRSWVKKLSAKLESHLQLLERQYLSLSSACTELDQYKKLGVMRQAEVVGMTTSAAARLYPVLQELCCPIVIVEEAAEVHESHIVATITKHCQHLILLGDHKQLRPRPSSYELSKTHFTDVSLFERLLLNNVTTVHTLLTQHRMQPQISELIRPSIYAKLYDHECTRSRENILGMKRNVFFFTHSWPECKNQVTGSYSNSCEAEMAVQLLNYLLKQGYSLKEICILTAYRQQVSEIENVCRLNEDLTDVQVLSIDNFQGEESRIVILSLVRNNTENKIGFLKIENRTCVALSRARDGLFILGNIHLLSYNSELWSSVHKVLKQNDAVGRSFPLRCERHPRGQMAVFQPSDFTHYLEKGCDQLCSYELPCGHSCVRKCHANDALHLQYRCFNQCRKVCMYGHKCQRLCMEDCENCEHIVYKHLQCGHRARMKCSQSSDYLCEAIVTKQMQPCSHFMKLRCWMPPLSQTYCTKQCPSLLKCGHQCPSQCSSSKHPHHNEMLFKRLHSCRYFSNREGRRNNAGKSC